MNPVTEPLNGPSVSCCSFNNLNIQPVNRSQGVFVQSDRNHESFAQTNIFGLKTVPELSVTWSHDPVQSVLFTCRDLTLLLKEQFTQTEVQSAEVDNETSVTVHKCGGRRRLDELVL